MMFRVSLFLLCLLSVNSHAVQLTHTFKSPAFNGNGYSAHVLTIENQEFSRSEAIREKKAAAEAMRDRRGPKGRGKGPKPGKKPAKKK